MLGEGSEWYLLIGCLPHLAMLQSHLSLQACDTALESCDAVVVGDHVMQFLIM